MMTKELVGAGQCRIIVPTVFRSEYIDALRALCDGDEKRTPSDLFFDELLLN